MRSPLLLFFSFWLTCCSLSFYSCGVRLDTDPDGEDYGTQADTIGGHRGLVIRWDETGGGGPIDEFKCAGYEDLSILDYIRDEALLWQHYLNRSHIAQFYRPDTGNAAGPFPPHLNEYPFTRDSLQPSRWDGWRYNCFDLNEHFYQPVYLERDDFVEWAEVPEAELTLFNAVYQYEYDVIVRKIVNEKARQIIKKTLGRQVAMLYPGTNEDEAVDYEDIYDQIRLLIEDQYRVFFSEIALPSFDRFNEALNKHEPEHGWVTPEAFAFLLSEAINLSARLAEIPDLPFRLERFLQKLPDKGFSDLKEAMPDLVSLVRGTRQDSSVAMQEVVVARMVFMETPYPDEEMLQLAYQKGILRLRIDSLQKADPELTPGEQQTLALLREEEGALNDRFEPLLQSGRRLPGAQALRQFREAKGEACRQRQKVFSLALSYDETRFHGDYYSTDIYSLHPDFYPYIDENTTVSSFYHRFFLLYAGLTDVKIRIAENIYEKVDKTIEALRTGQTGEVQRLIQEIDTSGTPDYLQYRAAINYEDKVKLDPPIDLTDTIRREFAMISVELQSIDSFINELELLFGGVPGGIWEKGERKMISAVLAEAKEMSAFFKNYLDPKALAARYGRSHSDIMTAAEWTGTLPNGHGGSSYKYPEEREREVYQRLMAFLSQFEEEEMEAYCRVKALEAAYLAVQDLYREKLDGVINRD